jgi:hypothetical protein
VSTLIKLILRVFILLTFWLAASQEAICQDRTGLIGIGIQLSTPPPFVYNLNYIYGAQSLSEPYVAAPAQGSMEMTPDILVSAWLTDQLAIEPSVGLMAYTNETQWRLGLTVVNHFGREKLKPFVLLRAKAYLSSSGSDLVYSNRATTMSNYFFGLGVGGEYFVGEKISVSGECQLNYLIPDKNGAVYQPDNTTSTGVSVSCRFYLN